MQALSHYLILAVLLLPVSALLSVLLCWLSPKLKRWLDRHVTRRQGNRYRDESWHSIQPGARLQTRTRR